MRIFDSIANAFARRIGWVLAGLVIAIVATVFNPAQAHTPTACGDSTNRTCDKGEALGASKDIANAIPHCTAAGVGPAQGYSEAAGWYPVFLTHAGGQTETNGSYSQQYAMRYSGNGAQTACGADTFYYGGGCSQRNADLNPSAIRYATSNADQCIAGCKYKIVSDAITKAIYGGSAGQQPVQTGTLYGGHWEYTGETCTNTTPPKEREEEEPKQECTAAGSGQTYCQKPDGQHCHTASTGRTICWSPGETGTKTDGATTQTQSTGNQPPATIEGSTNTSTTNVNTTTTNSSSTITINNYTTNSGAPAGSSNDGQNTGADGGPSGDGDGGPGGDGDSDDPQGETTGGGDCGTPPVTTGDPVGGAIVTQTWRTACEVEKSRGKIEGDATCNDGGVVGFACSGDQALCYTALKAKEQQCLTEWRNAQGEEQANQIAGEGNGLGETEASDVFGDGEANNGEVNEGLFGSSGGQCSFDASLQIAGQAIEIPSGFWSVLSMVSWLLTACAYLWVAYMLSR